MWRVEGHDRSLVATERARQNTECGMHACTRVVTADRERKSPNRCPPQGRAPGAGGVAGARAQRRSRTRVRNFSRGTVKRCSFTGWLNGRPGAGLRVLVGRGRSHRLPRTILPRWPAAGRAGGAGPGPGAGGGRGGGVYGQGRRPRRAGRRALPRASRPCLSNPAFSCRSAPSPRPSPRGRGGGPDLTPLPSLSWGRAVTGQGAASSGPTRECIGEGRSSGGATGGGAASAAGGGARRGNGCCRGKWC